MNKKHILKTFEKIKERNWDTLYWAIDIHDTCLEANYRKEVLPTDFFPGAKEALQRLSKRNDCCLILFTCSHHDDVQKYLTFFETHGIIFKYVNENPEVPNTHLGAFDKKFYTNFYVDDKAGFDPSEHWNEIHAALDHLETQEKI